MTADSGRPGSDSADDGAVLQESVEQAFSVLSDETRLRILFELVDAGVGTGLTFSELRDRVGVQDSGRFNYHLDKLAGTFVEKVDDEYVARYPAVAVVSAVISGTFRDPDGSASVELEQDCPRCARTIQLTYEQHTMRAECPECGSGDVFRSVPPAASDGRSLVELWNVVLERWGVMLDLARQGTCVQCWGSTTVEYPYEPDAFEAGDEGVLVGYSCERCPRGGFTTLRAMVGVHPEIVSLVTDDSGRRSAVLRPSNHESVSIEAELLSTDPARAVVRVDTENQTVAVTVDEDCAIEDIDHR